MRRAQTAAPFAELRFPTSRKSWSRNTAESFLLSPKINRSWASFSPEFRGRFLAELTIAAARSRAMVRNCGGTFRVDRLGDVEVGSVEIILTSYANERE